MRIAVFGNEFQTKKNAYINQVLEQLESLGADVCVERAFARFLNEEFAIAAERLAPFDARDLAADLVVSVGGDGTFLTTASHVGVRGIPILGVNTGHLGYLADVAPQEIEAALSAVVRGDYDVEQRAVIEVAKDGEPLRGCPFALNEVALLKHDNSSLIEIEAHVGDAFLNNYLADGLIVCTPTGSTGYSLSVGGPVLVPQSGTFCIAPVASHSLTTRPVVLRDDAQIRLRVRSRSHNFLIAVDGRSESVPEDTTISLRRAAHTIGVVKVMHRDYFDTLREKLMWGADRRK